MLLRAIRQLLYDEGYTIKGVQRLLKEQGARGLRVAETSLAFATEPEADSGEEPGGDEVGALADDGPPAVDAPAFDPRHDGALREALVCIEDCERILRALHRTAD